LDVELLASGIPAFAGMTVWGMVRSDGAIATMAKESAENQFYAELIEFAFNRDADINSWAWDLELQVPTAPPETVAVAIRRLCVNSGEDLKDFNNLQVAGGLKYIFDNSFSNYAFDLLNVELQFELRSSVLRSLGLLFEKCFAPRCTPVLSHGLGKAPDNPLNGICYMFWDTSPLSTGGPDILRVMENSLYLSNIACVESGLHGLGHAFYKNEKLVETAIDKFLASTSNINEKLLTYAMNARRGYIN
jgi:hypothetical protein